MGCNNKTQKTNSNGSYSIYVNNHMTHPRCYNTWLSQSSWTGFYHTNRQARSLQDIRAATWCYIWSLTHWKVAYQTLAEYSFLYWPLCSQEPNISLTLSNARYIYSLRNGILNIKYVLFQGGLNQNIFG